MPEQKADKTYKTLIHLGCGPNPNIEKYAAIAEQVYLIDADSKIVETLKERTQDVASIHAVHTLVDNEERAATFYTYNFTWANSLIPVNEELTRLYPSLQLVGEEERKTMSIHQLMEEYLPAQDTTAQNLLLLDLGSYNQRVLQTINDSQLLEKLGTIIALPAHRRSGQVVIPPNLYQTEAISIGLTLPDNSYALQPHPLLAECRHWKFQADQSKKQVVELQQKVEPLKEQLEQKTRELTEAREQLTQKQEELREQLDLKTRFAEELESAKKTLERSEQARSALEQDQQKRQQEMDRQEHALKAAQTQLNDQKTQLKETSEKLQEATKQNDEAIKAREESQAISSELRRERDELRRQLDEQNQALEHCRQEVKAKEAAVNAKAEEHATTLEELRIANKEHRDWQQQAFETEQKLNNLAEQHQETVKNMEAVQADYKEQQRSAQLSTKLLAKVEADLSELRERYAEKVKSEQELKDLIKELHAKLQAASHFYHKLEQEHPELLEKL